MTALSPTSDPAFTPSTANLFAASFQTNKDGVTASAFFKPLRMVSDSREVWGFQVGATATPGKPSTLSASYRLEYRWLFQGSVANQIARRALAICEARLDEDPHMDEGKLATAIGEQLERETTRMWFAVLPVITVEANAGFFFLDNTKKVDQRTSGSQSLALKLDWHFRNRLEGTASGAVSRERLSPDIAQDYASYRAGSLSLVYILPWLLGATYDERAAYQRGVGLGVAVSVKDCTEDPARYANCTAIHESYAGGILDIRLASSLQPRIIAGWHRYELATTSGTVSPSGFELGVQLATALQKSP